MYGNYFKSMGHYLCKLQLLTHTFQDWGYLPTLIPILDIDNTNQNINTTALKNNFKVLDSHGNILLLRSDTTISLAKMMKAHLNETQLPLRIYYFNNVARPSLSEQDMDILQLGIELVGTNNIAGDFETISLLDTALIQLALPQYKIFLGSLEIAHALIPSHIKQKELHLYHTALSNRDSITLTKYVGKKCAQLLLCICPSKEVGSLIKKIENNLFTKNKKTLQALQNYKILVEHLHKTLGENKVLCDFSEIGNNQTGYYTGSVFSVYMDTCSSAIAQGGRYDNLITKFNSINLSPDSTVHKTVVGACGGTIFPNAFAKYLLPYQENKIINEKKTSLHKKTNQNSIQQLSSLFTEKRKTINPLLYQIKETQI